MSDPGVTRTTQEAVRAYLGSISRACLDDALVAAVRRLEGSEELDGLALVASLHALCKSVLMKRGSDAEAQAALESALRVRRTTAAIVRSTLRAMGFEECPPGSGRRYQPRGEGYRLYKGWHVDLPGGAHTFPVSLGVRAHRRRRLAEYQEALRALGFDAQIASVRGKKTVLRVWVGVTAQELELLAVAKDLGRAEGEVGELGRLTVSVLELRSGIGDRMRLRDLLGARAWPQGEAEAVAVAMREHLRVNVLKV